MFMKMIATERFILLTGHIIICTYTLYSKNDTDAAWMKREKFESPPSSVAFIKLSHAFVGLHIYKDFDEWICFLALFNGTHVSIYVQSVEANPKFLTRITSIISDRGVRPWGGLKYIAVAYALAISCVDWIRKDTYILIMTP